MKALLRQEINFSHSITGTLSHHKYFLKGMIYLERFWIPTLATFETTSSSTVAEPFIAFWTPNTLVFTIAYSSLTIVSVTIQTSQVHWKGALIRRCLSKQGTPGGPK